MSEAQLDRVSAWRKAHRRLLDLPGLSLLELALLLVVERRGVRDVVRLAAGASRPDVGWSTRPDGRADSRRELADLCRLPPGAAGRAELDNAIAGLVELGHLVVADDGAIGMSGWAEQQESPDAQRKREARERADRAPKALPPGRDVDDRGAAPGQSAECPPQRTEDRGQRTELSERTDDARVREPVREPEQAPITAGSHPHSDARALLFELARMFVPTERGRAVEARRIKTSDLRALERAERLLEVPLEGLDEVAARRMRRERLDHVLGVCRDFAQLCTVDLEQAVFWGPTMLETRRGRGRDRSAWEVVESVVAERQQPRPAASARASPASSHVTARERDYGNGTQEL